MTSHIMTSHKIEMNINEIVNVDEKKQETTTETTTEEIKRVVSMVDLEKAKDKLIMGVERHSMVMDEKEKRMTAYHEAGHAIVGRIVPEHDPVYKISIMPRGRALGVTMFLPERDI